MTSSGSGARHTLDALFVAHFDDVYRFCRSRCGSSPLAEDAAAETFADAARVLARDSDAVIDVGWLFTVARRRLIDGWRREERERRRAERLEAEFSVERQRPDMAAGIAEMQQALGRLPDRQRAAVVLRYVDGCGVDEISRVLDTTYEAAASLLARARRNLLEAYEEVTS